MPGDFDEIAKQDLIARLAEGHAAGVTVVTPNRRLAQTLAREFDEAQVEKGLKVWETAGILPVGAFIERLYDDALYAESAGELPQLLAPAQERALWESVLAGQPLLSVGQAAADCADAWRLAHAWRIADVVLGNAQKFPGNQDTQAFAGWAKEYQRRVDKGGFVDSAGLPDVVLKHVGKKPKTLVAYGFEILPPQTGDFLETCRGLGIEIFSCGSGKKVSKNVKLSFPSARHELQAAAQWARARLEGGAKRIGVVLPGLQLRRREVLRVFSEVLRPGWNLPGVEPKAMPFDISIGEPLDDYAIVDFALSILELGCREIEFENASQLIRSPFLGGAETEFAARARLDVRLRRELGKQVSLPRLIGLLEGCPLLRRRFEMLYEAKGSITSKQHSPHDWARHFTALLGAAGFPGERAPDSREFQARARFNEVLGEFSRLGLLSGKMSFPEALRHLRRICADTLFQPETPDAPIEVLGILESAGLEFDCLWVSGLTEEAWPLAARANPFLPVLLQKKAGIPEAAAETSLALDRRITEGWLAAAHEVVFSYPEKEKDRDLLPSPLIAQVPDGKVDSPSFLTYREVLFSSCALESVADGKALPLSSGTLKGGTRVLADQAACPFRAFARHRLGAEGLQSPAEGLDAMQRGQLLHALMAGIWSELKSSSSLSGNVKPAIEKSAASAVKALGLEGRFAELETQRLIRLAAEWLAVERERPPFEVIHIEEKRNLQVAGLSFSGRIDRMDRLAGGENAGSHVLIDYKTGRATPQSWLGERPDEPQLPLYVVTAEEKVSAVAFAKLQPGAMKFSGFSLKEKEIPGVRQAKSWSGLIGSWRKELESLASGFAQGDARVDPKKGLATCRNCDLQPLCRVHERLNALADADEEGE